jgi:spore coat polysaccharide biosynthesis protein SpsF
MASNDVGIILQARLGSSRLPGKALASVGGTCLLRRCLQRLGKSAVGPVVLATTTQPEDDELASVAHKMGVAVYRGSTEDVLGRYVDTALLHGFGTVIRATGDNPAVDIDAAARLIRARIAADADYACEDGLPCGAGVEIVTTAALVRAATLATNADDREHVTTCIKRRHDRFRVLRAPAPARLQRPDLRFTVDTEADLSYMRRLFARVRPAEPSLSDLIAAADECSRSDAA